MIFHALNARLLRQSTSYFPMNIEKKKKINDSSFYPLAVTVRRDCPWIRKLDLENGVLLRVATAITVYEVTDWASLTPES